MARDEHWVTVQEAARRLGVKEDAVRKRIQRGTLRSEKDLEDGRVYVYLDTTQDAAQDTAYDKTQDTAYDAAQDGLVVELRDRVVSLERMLDQEREARTEERRRHDTLMATLMQRIPELEAPEDRENVTEDRAEANLYENSNGAAKEPDKHRSWWRRFFGFE